MENQQPSTFKTILKIDKICHKCYNYYGDKMKQELSKIKGFENCKNYYIYDNGKLYNKKTKKFLKPLRDSSGYLYYDIRNANAIYKCPKVHRLVMLAFSNEEEKQEINHKDGNKHNNRISNLEWVTHKENRNHALKTGLSKEINYGIMKCSLDGTPIKYYNTCREALIELGKDKNISGNIGRCIRGKRKSAYGYVWKQCEGSTTIPNGSTLK
jgi:hypothetical protein